MNAALAKSPMFQHRVLSSLCVILVLIGAIFWAPAWAYHALIGLFAAIGLAELIAMCARRGKRWALLGMGGGLFYVGIPYLALSQLYQGIAHPGLPGHRLVALCLLVTKGCDIGAYLIGRSIGKRPLVPTISPKKTVEGGVGGLVVSVLAAALSASYLPEVSLWQLILVGVILGIVAQAGDLFESIVKRACQVKDSGWLLPGLGGVLDTIDSVLFAAPVFYVLVRLTW